MSQNIHEIGDDYANRRTDETDSLVEEFGFDQDRYDSGGNIGENGREHMGIDEVDSPSIPREGRSNQRGNRQDASRSKGNKKAIGYHFEDDGHYTVTYADGTKRRYSRSLTATDQAYLTAVDQGDMDTAQRMVDEAAKAAGYDKLFYHGAKGGGGFTIFRDWSYFTENKQYASRYADREKPNSLYTTYVKLDKPFDTRKVSDRTLFNAIRKKYGLSELQDTGLPDWTDGYDIAEYIGEKDLSYDGIILDEGGDMVDGSPVSRGLSYVVRKSAQVKSADAVTYDADGNIIPLSERFNPLESDIRYSKVIKISSETNDSPTIGSVMTSPEAEAYQPNRTQKLRDFTTSMQILFTNAQAGIEKYGKSIGIKDIESKVQVVRSAAIQANEMIGGDQWRITGENKERLGKGLQKILDPITKKGEEETARFYDYLANLRNIDSMTLEQRSIEEQKARLSELAQIESSIKTAKQKLTKILKSIEGLGRTKAEAEKKKSIREKSKELKVETNELTQKAKDLKEKIDSFVPRSNKPVVHKLENGIEVPVSAEESREIVNKYEQENPEYRGIAEELWGFLRNLNQFRVDTGLLRQETADVLQDLFPHYVPAYREGTRNGIASAVEGKHDIRVKSTVKAAKGSLKKILPIGDVIARQVRETIVAGRVNQLATELYKSAMNGETSDVEIVSREKVAETDLVDFDATIMRPKDEKITFFLDGEKCTIKVSREIFEGFQQFFPNIDSRNPAANFLTWVNKTFKSLVTSYNPAFLVRNSIRDLQDAGINSKFPKQFVKNYARAVEEIRKNGKLWQLYRAMGGFTSTVFNFKTGEGTNQNKIGLTKAEGNLLKKGITAIENANAFIEQIPRLAEFISSVEAGNTVEQALLDSADVTTNFGRSGKVTQVLNRTLVPFLNASIQGFSKTIRNVTSIKTSRQAASLAFRVALIGIVPQVINMLMYAGDKDYEELRDSDKENNFLFKVGDKFVKLPRGRVASVVGGLVNRSALAIKGEDVDFWGYLDNALQQATPVDSMSRTILSPILVDLPNNVTWYGSAIEGREMENRAPKDRYDEGTSSIAKAISDVLHAAGIGGTLSPKKIHYLIDQYSGVIGDFILPMTTKKAEKGFFSGNFTIDPVTSNKLSSQFYKLYDESTYAKTAGDAIASYQVKYLNKVKGAISEMYDKKSEIENSDLSDAEKRDRTRVIQALINEAYRTAIADFDLFTRAIEVTEGVEDSIRETEATRIVYGAERALREYNSNVYKKATALSVAGVDYDLFYDYYFTTRGIESQTDAKGNMIEGSKRKQVIAAINELEATKQQKLLLVCASGYTIKDGDIKGVSATYAKILLWRYLLTITGLSTEDKEYIAKMCGLTVKNGRISLK